MNSPNLKNGINECLNKLKEERCGKVLRKMFWLFAGGDTGRWFEGKPQNIPSTINSEKKLELLSRQYSVEFIAGRVYRACTVNYELAEDKMEKVTDIMENLQECGLVECLADQEAESQKYWKLTKLGLACSLSVKEEIMKGDKITWDIEEVKRKMNNLEKAASL